MRSPWFCLQISLQLDWFAESFVVPTTRIGAQSDHWRRPKAYCTNPDSGILSADALLLISWLPMSFTRTNGLKYVYLSEVLITVFLTKGPAFPMAAPLLLLEISCQPISCVCINCIFNETQVVTLSLSALSCLDQPTLTPFFPEILLLRAVRPMRLTRGHASL